MQKSHIYTIIMLRIITVSFINYSGSASLIVNTLLNVSIESGPGDYV